MAARAQARRTASKPRRRPARRPAARKGASRVNWDRVGRIVLTLVLVAVAYSYLNPAIDFVRTYTATTAAKAQQHELQAENTRLHRRIQSTDDPIVIERMARAQGMVAEGETPVVIRGLGN
jgi:cell division protein FtsB